MCAVARRHGFTPQQLIGWRRAARRRREDEGGDCVSNRGNSPAMLGRSNCTGAARRITSDRDRDRQCDRSDCRRDRYGDIADGAARQALSQIDRLRHLLRQLQSQFGRRSEKLDPEQRTPYEKAMRACTDRVLSARPDRTAGRAPQSEHPECSRNSEARERFWLQLARLSHFSGRAAKNPLADVGSIPTAGPKSGILLTFLMVAVDDIAPPG